MTDPKDIGAFVDGELDGPAEAAFRARLATEETLAREVERHADLNARLRAAYGPVVDEPVPERLADLVRNAGGPGRRIASWRLAHVAAMAACLAVGIFAGRSLVETGPIHTGADGRLLARGALAGALDRQLAADQQGRPVQVGLSFRTAAGDYCRSFQSVRYGMAGVACRRGESWVMHTTTTFAPTASGEYRTAGAGAPPQVLADVDALIAGEPLDQAGERAARDAGWRRP